MKKIVSMIVLAVLVLSMPVAYAQAVTEWERQVYYKTINRVASLPQESTEEDYNKAAIEVAKENGLTSAEIDALGERIWNSGLSEREGVIVDDLYERLGAIPVLTMSKEQSDAAYERVYSEVASKYGISTTVLLDIDMRAWL